jgi:hypothetical protein
MVNSIYQGNRMEELRLDKRGLSGLQLPLLAQGTPRKLISAPTASMTQPRG